jgi:amino acid adenylation domain-containing protein
VITRSDLQSVAPLAELPPLTPDDTAYLLFTSGSTGVPKGVRVTHGNVLHFIEVMSKRYQVTPEDRLSQTFDQTFDLSVFDIFMSWFNGACLYTISPIELLSPSDFINRNGLTIWFSVPSVAIQMVKRGTLKPNSLKSLRLSLFCGEPLESRIAQAWQSAASGSVLENLYGPTELTIACFAYTWDSVRTPAICKNDYVPIGHPLDGLSACILDEDSMSMMESGPGELAVTGPQITPGYWNDKVQTRARFVELPVSRNESRRFYRTGDRVMRLSDGSYAFLGRTDQQIKVLGHRVELGEVESVLRRIPGVEYAVALGWPAATLNAESVIAVVSGTDQLDIDAMRFAAGAALPPYMVPKTIYRRSSMPLNANGKIDRQRLLQELEQAAQGARV